MASALASASAAASYAACGLFAAVSCFPFALRVYALVYIMTECVRQVAVRAQALTAVDSFANPRSEPALADIEVLSTRRAQQVTNLDIIVGS
jgi:hypothetical protein